VFRSKRRALPTTGEWINVKNDRGNTVKVLLVEDPVTQEKHLYCQSSGRKRREEGMKNRLQQSFEKDLIDLNKKLHNSYWRKSYERVVEKIGKLRQKYERISRFYEIDVLRDDKGFPAKIVHKIKLESLEQQFNGSYCLRTDLKEIGAKELWEVYMTLSNAEEAFRDLKSHLGLRPIHHQKEHRVDGHMWITLLAYHLVHSIRHRLRANNLNLSWATIRDRLRSHERVTTCQTTESGHVLHIRNTTEPEEYQKEIYRALQMPQIPLPLTITKV
jgi:transposase